MVFNSSCDDLITVRVSSQHLLKTPSTPVTPIPSIRSLVKRNGIISGVGRVLPCSNATPTWEKLIYTKYLSLYHSTDQDQYE